MDILSYDKYIVAFSGGKDSTACFLHLLDCGVPTDKIELWHHDIDGHGETFMDWEVTPAYCMAFAKAFNVSIYFSWKDGGFKREMLRNDTATAPITFEVPKSEWETSTSTNKTIIDGKYYISTGGNGPLNTRLKFPQVSANLSVRWCSSYLKIDVCASAVRNQSRFNGIKTLILSGERGEESAARAKYEILENDRADNRNGVKTIRYIDRYRPIRDWKEEQVWEIISRYKIRCHPAYYLGFSRVSCKFCIFGNANQTCSAHKISPKQGNEIIAYEEEFGLTIKRNISMKDLIAKGEPYDMDEEIVAQAISYDYKLDIFMNNWILPKGAYGDSCGPA